VFCKNSLFQSENQKKTEEKGMSEKIPKEKVTNLGQRATRYRIRLKWRRSAPSHQGKGRGRPHTHMELGNRKVVPDKVNATTSERSVHRLPPEP